MRRSKTKSGEQGQVIIEFAFVVPLLGLILLCIVDLGLVVREYQVVQNAAREAARYSAQEINQMSRRSPAEAASIEADIQNFAARYAAQEGITIDPSWVLVTQRYAIPDNCGSQITITYPRQFLLLGAPLLPTGTVTLTARALFYNLYGC